VCTFPMSFWDHTVKKSILMCLVEMLSSRPSILAKDVEVVSCHEFAFGFRLFHFRSSYSLGVASEHHYGGSD